MVWSWVCAARACAEVMARSCTGSAQSTRRREPCPVWRARASDLLSRSSREGPFVPFFFGEDMPELKQPQETTQKKAKRFSERCERGGETVEAAQKETVEAC